jgi:single-strand DNA-binding protein
MLNQVVLVGRLTDDLTVTEYEGGKKVTTLILAVQRTSKNSDGIYETDFIRCTLWNAIADRTAEYCKKGDIVGIKGRLQVSSYEDKKGNKQYSTEVIAEKVTFLSSKGAAEENEE